MASGTTNASTLNNAPNFTQQNNALLQQLINYQKTNEYNTKSLIDKIVYLSEKVAQIEENDEHNHDKDDLKIVKEDLRKASQFVMQSNQAKEEVYTKYGGNKEDNDFFLQNYKKRIELEKYIQKLQQDNNSGRLSKEVIDANNRRIVQQQAKLSQLDRELKDYINRQPNEIKKNLTVLKNITDAGDGPIKKQLELNEAAEEYTRISNENLKLIEKYNRRVEAVSERRLKKLATYKQLISDGIGILKNITEKWLEIEAASKNSAKAIGLNKEQAIGYQKAIASTAKELARTYGMTFEQTAKLQDMYNNATDRSTMLSREQMTDVAAMTQLIGDEATSTIIENMDKLGGGVQSATIAMGKAQLQAKAMGLNIVKASSAFAKNMSMANKYSFKNGVDGVMKMTMLAQKLKFNLESMSGVFDKFTNIQDAIETSANLQMMGGEAAMLFGNPMENLYQGLNDPEALVEKMTKLFAGKAVFNAKTGEADLKGYNLQWVKEVAKAAGMNADEAVQMAKQSAKIQHIDSNMTASVKGNERLKNLIESRAEYDEKTQQYKITYLDENNEQRSEFVSAITANDEWIERLAAQEEPIEDIRKYVRKLADDLTPIRNKIAGAKEAYNIGKAEFVENSQIGNIIRGVFQGTGWAGGLNKYFEGAMDLFTNGGLGTFANMLIGGLMFGSNIYSQKALTRATRHLTSVGKPELIRTNNVPSSSLGGGQGGGTAQPQSTTTPPKGGNQPQSTTNQPKGGNPQTNQGNVARARRTRMPRVLRARARRISMHRAGKWGGRIGVPIAALFAAYEGYEDYQAAKAKTSAKNAEIEANANLTTRQKEVLKNANLSTEQDDKNKAIAGATGTFAGGLAGAKLGAMGGAFIGSFLGPIGTAVGGAIGGIAGGAIGAVAGSKIGKAFGATDNRTDKDVLQEDFETQKFGMDVIAKSLQVDPSGENLKLLAAQATIKMNDILVSIWNHMNGKQSNGAVENKGFIDNMADKGIGAAVGGVLKNLFSSDKDKESKTHYFGAFKGEGDVSGDNAKSISVPKNSVIGNDIQKEGDNAGLATVNGDEVVMHRDKIINLGNAFNELVNTTNAANSVSVNRNKEGDNNTTIWSRVAKTVLGGMIGGPVGAFAALTPIGDKIADTITSVFTRKRQENNNEYTTNEVASVAENIYASNITSLRDATNNYLNNDYSNSITSFKGDQATFVTENGLKQQFALAPVNQKPVGANVVTPMYSQPNFNVQVPSFELGKMDLNITLNGAIDLKGDGSFSGSRLDADKLLKENPYFMDRLTYIIMESMTRKMHGGQRFGQTKM